MNKSLKKEKTTNGFKDTFNFFMLENVKLIGCMELPYIPRYVGPLPTKITNYLKNVSDPRQYFVHHYLYDYAFDGRNGVWYGCQKNSKHMSYVIDRYKKYGGVISTDFSVYIDLPLIVQIWNIYRNRMMCMWLRNNGLNVIFNLRWGDYRTYDYAFSGIDKHSVVAIGSHGLIKHPENRKIFLDGFKEMLKRVEPAIIIIYGSLTKEMDSICKTYHADIIHFDSEQTAIKEGKI